MHFLIHVNRSNSRLQARPGHYLSKIKPRGAKKDITRTCVVCGPAERKQLQAAGIRKKRAGRESAYECTDCGGKALCVEPCFHLYHTQEQFEVILFGIMTERSYTQFYVFLKRDTFLIVNNISKIKSTPVKGLNAVRLL